MFDVKFNEMSKFALILVTVNLCTIFSIEAARILAVFPTPSISHQVVFRSLTNELVKRGHEIVVITTDPAYPKNETPANLTVIDVHDLSYKTWHERGLSMVSGKELDMPGKLELIYSILVEVSKEQFLSDEVQQIMNDKSRKFDLLILEACSRAALAFSHVFKAPVILVSSFGAIPGNYEMVGAPIYPPLLYPAAMRQRLYNLSFREKMTELYNHFRVKLLFFNYEEKINGMIREVFGSDVPKLHELDNNVDMIFFNTHVLWEDNRPVPPSVVYMGGIHQKPVKELPEDLKLYLDSSPNGVIYVSFGTNTSPSSFPPDKVQTMVKVFSHLPYDILWKWDKEELPGRSENIRIFKWLPQSDLLMHPKIKLFITQGGLQSTDEAITAGVPLIGMPMHGDQWFNVEKYSHHKIGLRCDIETLTEEAFTEAINIITGDESYRRNVEKLHTLMLDQPQRPLERAVWWTEHVLRHGSARHLRAPAANMSWSQYLELELVSILLICLLSVIIVLGITIYLLMKIIKNILMGNTKLKVS